MALDPQETKDAGRGPVPVSLQLFSHSPSPPLIHEIGNIDSEREPLPQAITQIVDDETSPPARELRASQQAQQPAGLQEPVVSPVFQDHSASATGTGTGSTPQVHLAPDADDSEPAFALTNPFRIPYTRTAPTTEDGSRRRSTSARLVAELVTIVRRVVSVPQAVEVEFQRWLMLMYINLFLLHLPALYFMRVARVFQDAQLSQEEVEQFSMHRRTRGVTTLSPGLSTFKESWEALVDSLMMEWKTLNLVSALLLTAILTLLQFPGVGTDPVLRNTAFLSLVYALLCLLYGCLYVIRFGSLRNMSKGLSWVYEAEQSKSEIWWSVWVFLALPSLYLVFSMLWFVVTVLGFIWESGAVGNVDQHPPLSFHTALTPRIIITVQLVPGVSYFVMIVKMMWTHEMMAVGIAERGEM